MSRPPEAGEVVKKPMRAGARPGATDRRQRDLREQQSTDWSRQILAARKRCKSSSRASAASAPAARPRSGSRPSIALDQRRAAGPGWRSRRRARATRRCRDTSRSVGSSSSRKVTPVHAVGGRSRPARPARAPLTTSCVAAGELAQRSRAASPRRRGLPVDAAVEHDRRCRTPSTSSPAVAPRARLAQRVLDATTAPASPSSAPRRPGRRPRSRRRAARGSPAAAASATRG